jgi:hypothetical protein
VNKKEITMENEVLDIVEKLLDRYGNGMHWEIMKIEDISIDDPVPESRVFNLTIRKIEKEAKDESNK